MKKFMIISLSVMILMPILFQITFAANVSDNSMINLNFQSNVDKIIKTNNFSNSISMAEYPIDIKATYNKLNKLITCNIMFNSNLKENSVFVQIYSTGGETDSMKFSDTVNRNEKISFVTSKTEHVISIKCEDST